MNGMIRRKTSAFAFSVALIAGGCSAGSGSAGDGKGKAGNLTADPNPIPVCDGSRTGITTLRNSSGAPGAAEIRLGSSTGKLFAALGPGETAVTGKWVVDGMEFFLVKGSETLGTVRVGFTRQGCP